MEIAFSAMLLYSGTFSRCTQKSMYGVSFVVVYPTHILVHPTHVLVHPGVRRAHRLERAALENTVK